jgi:hypothetical protein
MARVAAATQPSARFLSAEFLGQMVLRSNCRLASYFT